MSTAIARRRRLLVVLLLGCLAAACSTADIAETPAATASEVAGEPATQEPATQEPPTVNETATEEEGEATRTVTDFRGEEVEVPARPERVATFDLTPTINLALLGLDPVTAPEDLTSSFELVEEFLPEGVDTTAYDPVGYPVQELNVEAIAAADPDLIMGYASAEEANPGLVEQLSAIAPTVLYDFGTNADWRERFHTEAEILGRTDEAEALEAAYEQELADLAIPTDQALAFIRYEFDGGGAWRLENPETSVPGSVMTDAGATLWQPPADIGELNPTGSFYPNLSAERLDLLTADVVVIQDLTDFGQEDPIGLFEGNPLWSGLPAVQAGQVATLPALVFNGGTYPTGILTARTVADLVG